MGAEISQVPLPCNVHNPVDEVNLTVEKQDDLASPIAKTESLRNDNSGYFIKDPELTV